MPNWSPDSAKSSFLFAPLVRRPISDQLGTGEPINYNLALATDPTLLSVMAVRVSSRSLLSACSRGIELQEPDSESILDPPLACQDLMSIGYLHFVRIEVVNFRNLGVLVNLCLELAEPLLSLAPLVTGPNRDQLQVFKRIHLDLEIAASRTAPCKIVTKHSLKSFTPRMWLAPTNAVMVASNLRKEELANEPRF